MQNRNWQFLYRVIGAVAVISMFASFAVAQSSDDVRALFAAAPKEATNIGGVKIFAGPPQGFNPLTASNSDLATYGLPQRPDKATNAKGYQLWERAVLAAKHRAPAKLTAKPYSSVSMRGGKLQSEAISGTPGSVTATNWSGVASTNKLKTWSNKTSFDAVLSVFNVPVAQPPFGACANGIGGPFYEVSWNGIDGFFGNANGDVVQGGSFSAADCEGDTEYFAWIEWFPSYSILAAFTVNPGDDMYVVTYGAPGTSTQTVFVEDFTLQEFGTYELPWVQGPGLIGGSAEYIVERPCCASGGVPLALANYIYDFFNYDFAFDVAGKQFNAGAQSATTYNITMVNDNGSQDISGVGAGATGEQGNNSLWFFDEGCAYSGGCTP